jgi:hypothetical protein
VGIALAVLLVLAATAVVGYQVFAPAEIQTLAHKPYPAQARASSGISGQLSRTPLIVDGRLRVYAARRQVWADPSIRARTEEMPYWSLRRWPYELVGVVAAPGPLVVSKWSDGALVAIGARTGTVAWRARAPVGQRDYTGGRTGASTVYEPPDLYTGRTTDGRPVVVATGPNDLAVFDAAHGTPLWNAGVPRSCPSLTFTAPGFVARWDSCTEPAVLHRYDLATGEPLPDWRPPEAGGGWEITPLGCASGRSECTAARTRGADGTDQGWLLGPDISGAPPLAPAATWPVNDLAVGGPAGGGTEVTELTARSLGDGAPQWTWRPPEGSVDTSPARIVAVERRAIYLITQRRTLVVLDPQTGRELARSPLDRFGERVQAWVPGHVHARNRFVVVERLRDPPAPADAGEDARYLGLRPVVVTGS